mgnify:CR=1 FL=1
MRNYKTFFGILLLFFTSCDKPAVKPNSEMTFNDLQNKEVKFNEFVTIDMSNDGVVDLRFSTLLVGDPIAQQDKQKYLVTSLINCFLPVNSQENTPVLNKGESIPLENFQGCTWYEIAQIELAQKVIGMTGAPFWEGLWKSVNHNYLPVQIKVNNQRYNGWIELSFDMSAGKIILHKSAISKLPEKNAVAGV